MKISEVYFNGNLYQITAHSETVMGSMIEMSFEPVVLLPSVSDSELGSTVRLAFKASRESVSYEELYEAIESGVADDFLKLREEKLMKRFGYKTIRAMNKGMNNCSIKLSDGQITIQPMHQNALNGYGLDTTMNMPEFVVSENVSDAEFGKKIKEAFTHCTSIYSR